MLRGRVRQRVVVADLGEVVVPLVGVAARAILELVADRVVVVALDEPARRPALGGVELSDRVRAAASEVDVAAVLTVPRIPVDKRHNSKVDRSSVARWAERVLAGGRMGMP